MGYCGNFWETTYYDGNQKSKIFTSSKNTKLSSEKILAATNVEINYMEDLDKVAKETKHLDSSEKSKLKKLLKKYEELFDCTIGTWKMDC